MKAPAKRKQTEAFQKPLTKAAKRPRRERSPVQEHISRYIRTSVGSSRCDLVSSY